MDNYIPVKAFLKWVDDIKNRIYRQMKNEKPDSILNVSISHGLYKDGNQINLNDKKLVEICLVSEEPKVYGLRIGGTNSHAINYCYNLHLSFQARDVILQGENRLKLKQYINTFDTYEDYLKLLTTQFNRHINHGFAPKINTLVKQHFLTLKTIVANALSDESRKVLFQHDDNVLRSLTLYQSVPESVRKEVDTILCPFTLQCKDVSLGLGDVSMFGKIEIFQKDGDADKVYTPYKQDKFTALVKNN